MTLPKFSTILKLAERHHGADGIKAKLAEQRRVHANLKQGDDRFLAGMAKAIFSSGFSWDVVEQKWPGFEKAFDKFDPRKVAAYGAKDIARLMKDAGIVRNGPKIKATIANARFVRDIADEHGSFSAFLKGWPASDQIGLMEYLKTYGARLGGATAMYFLRFNGWDAFILSADVTKALMREGVIDKPATSKAALRAVQEAFNNWAQETGRPQRELSRILALSVG
ncbi:MAG: DNA-3-methyladenine glycosylase I [Proteobacteria bacterium]|nr:DNA-3-methyladenine glycosylase I [Pseudomonadota bacterium]